MRDSIKVALGVAFGMTFAAVTFFGGPQKKPGHNLMDVERPEEVQNTMDKAMRSRMAPSSVAKKVSDKE